MGGSRAAPRPGRKLPMQLGCGVHRAGASATTRAAPPPTIRAATSSTARTTAASPPSSRPTRWVNPNPNTWLVNPNPNPIPNPKFAPNQVIRGWTEAMQMMVEGDKWELYIPPRCASMRVRGTCVPRALYLAGTYTWRVYTCTTCTVPRAPHLADAYTLRMHCIHCTRTASCQVGLRCLTLTLTLTLTLICQVGLRRPRAAPQDPWALCAHLHHRTLKPNPHPHPHPHPNPHQVLIFTIEIKRITGNKKPKAAAVEL